MSDREKQRRREYREKFRVAQKSSGASSDRSEEAASSDDFEEKATRKAPRAWLTTITYDPKSFIMAMISQKMGEHDDENDDFDYGSTILDKPIELVNGNFPPGYYTIHCTFLSGPNAEKSQDPSSEDMSIVITSNKPLVFFQLKNHANEVVDTLTLPVDPMFSPMTRSRVPGLDRVMGTDIDKANAIMRQQERAFAYAMSGWLDPDKNESFFNGVYGIIIGNAWPMMDNIFDALHGIGEAFEEADASSETPATPKETPKPHPGENLAPELVACIQDAYSVIAKGFADGDISGGIHAVKLSIVNGVKSKLGDVKEGVLAKVVGVAPGTLKGLLQELESLEFKTLYNEAAMDEAVHDAEFEIHDAVDCIVEALIDDEQRASFEDTTAMGRITYEIASRVSKALNDNKATAMQVLGVDGRGMGKLFAKRYSRTPQFPEPSAE